MDKLIITAAIVGAELTPAQMPALPVTARQIGEAAEECCEAGASIIHLHVRDGAGNPSQAVDDSANAVDEIRRRCDVIVQFSTGGAVGTPIELRAAPLRLAPEMATLTTGTVNFGDDVFLVGFGTDRGTVAAASDWGGPMEVKAVRPSHARSYGRVCHDAGIPAFMLTGMSSSIAFT